MRVATVARWLASPPGAPSPAMHDAAYREVGLDARYVPLELDDLDEARSLLGSSGLAAIEGLAVTMPFKRAAWERCVGWRASALLTRPVGATARSCFGVRSALEP